MGVPPVVDIGAPGRCSKDPFQAFHGGRCCTGPSVMVRFPIGSCHRTLRLRSRCRSSRAGRLKGTVHSWQSKAACKRKLAGTCMLIEG